MKYVAFEDVLKLKDLQTFTDLFQNCVPQKQTCTFHVGSHLISPFNLYIFSQLKKTYYWPEDVYSFLKKMYFRHTNILLKKSSRQKWLICISVRPEATLRTMLTTAPCLWIMSLSFPFFFFLFLTPFRISKTCWLGRAGARGGRCEGKK